MRFWYSILTQKQRQSILTPKQQRHIFHIAFTMVDPRVVRLQPEPATMNTVPATGKPKTKPDDPTVLIFTHGLVNCS